MDRQYFIIIPNMIDDAELSLIAFRLYVHIKRVAGEDGVCYQTTETLSKNCNMSTGSISHAKEELISKHFIKKTVINTGRGKPLHTIKIIDIWNKNMKKYSPDEFITSPDEFITSPDEIKKNPINNIPIKEDFAVDKSTVSEPTYEPCTEDGEPVLEKKKRKKNTDDRSKHPAIVSFRRLTGRYPPKINYDQVIDVLGDNPDELKMKHCYQEWCGRGYKPVNLAWLLDWYVNGISKTPMKKNTGMDAVKAELARLEQEKNVSR